MKLNTLTIVILITLFSSCNIRQFSHVHKSGGGCNEALDIMFMPLNGSQLQLGDSEFPSREIQPSFLHEEEIAAPGHYKVTLEDFNIDLELTATTRCRMQKCTFKKEVTQYVLIDLLHGGQGACTIIVEDNYDTVRDANLLWDFFNENQSKSLNPLES